MIYTLTLNPAIDYVTRLDEFKLGAVNRVQSEAFYPGGKGINVSRLLKNLQVESIALGFVAGFSGKFIEESLENSSIQTDFIHLEAGCTRISVKLKTAQEETEINASGPLITARAKAKLFEKLDQLCKGDVLVLAGKVGNGLSDEFYAEVMQRLKGRDIRFVVDAMNTTLLSTLKHRPFLIKPNKHELEEMFNVKITTLPEIICYAKRLREMGAANVLISMGREGALLVAEDGIIYKGSVPNGEVKNSVGAGDSMVAGFIIGYMETENYAEALKMGLICGSATAFSDDLATAKDVDKMIQETKLDIQEVDAKIWEAKT